VFLHWPLSSPTAVPYIYNSTGVDLSKILGGQTKILGEKVINAWAFLNYWGARARAAPQSLYYILRKCMNQPFQEFLLIMQLFIGKMIKK